MKKFTYAILSSLFVFCFATQSIGQCVSQGFEGGADNWIITASSTETRLGNPPVVPTSAPGVGPTIDIGGSGVIPATPFASVGSSAWIVNGVDLGPNTEIKEIIELACTNIEGLKGVTVSFDYAGFTNDPDGQGIDNNDMIQVEISLDGGATFSTEASLRGDNTDNNHEWSHGTGTGIIHAFGSAPANGTVYRSLTNAGPSSITFTIPDCRATDMLCVRIAADVNRADEWWAIDNIQLNNSINDCTPIPCAITNVNVVPSCNGDDAEFVITWDDMGIITDAVPPFDFVVDVNGVGSIPFASGDTYTILGPTPGTLGVTVTVQDDCILNDCVGTIMVDIPTCPECGFPEPVIVLEEDCGAYNIIVGAIDETGASGTGTVVTFTTAPVDPTYPVVGGTVVTGTDALPTNGGQIWIQICDAADASCCSEFGPFTEPDGGIPSCGVFPANGN